MNQEMIRYEHDTLQTVLPRDVNDEMVIDLWLRGKRSEHTQRAYRSDIEALMQFTGTSLRETTLVDLQDYADSLTGNATSQARHLASVKSFFTFASKTGYLQLNVGSAINLPHIKEDLAQRILSEAQMIRIIDATHEQPRNHALLRLMYHCGLRVSEVVELCWSDVVERDEGGQVTIFGKGGKTRHVLISQDMYEELVALQGWCESADAVFQSRKGHGHLDESQINRIVSDAAKRAGIKGNVSPHWFRHAHASHSLDNHAPVSLVQATLGHKSLVTTSKYTHARPNASSSQFIKI